MTPHPCVVLAVDTATTSGWAIYSCGVRLNSGEVDINDDAALLGICNAAVKWSGELATVLVLERAYGGTKATIEGLAMARKAWLIAWKKANGTKTARRVVLVYPQQWRSPLGFRGKVPVAMQKAYLRAHELDYPHREAGPDEFEALLIGLWACRASEVAAVLPKGAKRAELR
jgi:hypothetical protein